jgi:tRNA (guanine-N7-)-methyltransferase
MRSMSATGTTRSPLYLEVMAARRQALVPRCTGILEGGQTPVLEVGSGHGHFLTAYAQQHPDRLCVGIDLVSERVERALRKRDRARLPNLHFLQAEMRFFLECVPPETRWREIFVLFPDPWPKSRHHKHRLIQEKTLALLAKYADPECRLYFRTDFRPYFDAANVVFVQSDCWDMVSEPWPFEFETVFQRRAAAHYSLIAKRRA